MKTEAYCSIIELIKREVVPALGCTEPIAVALAVAKARQVLGNIPEIVDVQVSGNIFKNGMGVGIPGTGMKGLSIASALGAIVGDPDALLEVLHLVNVSHVEEAKQWVETKRVVVGIKEVEDKLYVEATCKYNGDTSRVIIAGRHTNIVFVELNGIRLNDLESEQNDADSGGNESDVNLNLAVIWDFVQNVDLADIEFIMEGVKLNRAIAEEGLKKPYGLRVGQMIQANMQKGILGDGLANYAASLTSAASDARMDGCTLPVMSNSGSGNQGLSVMVPIIAVAEKLNVSHEQYVRAMTLSNLVAIHIKHNLGALSALCGCVVAASGAACGITYLLGGDFKQICYAVKNMVANITGMICDGAKVGCALKVSTGVNTAFTSALLAIDNIEVEDTDGIIDKDVEKTIRNLTEIGRKGMNETDRMLLEIMVCK